MPSKKWWSTLLHERICTYVSPLFHEENQRCSKLGKVQIQPQYVGQIENLKKGLKFSFFLLNPRGIHLRPSEPLVQSKLRIAHFRLIEPQRD